MFDAALQPAWRQACARDRSVDDILSHHGCMLRMCQLKLCQVLTELFESPPRPVRLEMPARVTRLAICLQARAMLLRTVASSPSMVPFCSSCSARRTCMRDPLHPPHLAACRLEATSPACMMTMTVAGRKSAPGGAMW